MVDSLVLDEKENPVITFEDLESSRIKKEKFDMVVLATCIIPPTDIGNLANTLKIELDKNQFIKTKDYSDVLLVFVLMNL